MTHPNRRRACGIALIAIAGEHRYSELMMPISIALADRCDACLRVGGPSQGADEEVGRFRAAGRPVFHSLDALSAALPEV